MWEYDLDELGAIINADEVKALVRIEMMRFFNKTYPPVLYEDGCYFFAGDKNVKKLSKDKHKSIMKAVTRVIDEIRLLHTKNELNTQLLNQRFGVAYGTIESIKNDKLYVKLQGGLQKSDAVNPYYARAVMRINTSQCLKHDLAKGLYKPGVVMPFYIEKQLFDKEVDFKIKRRSTSVVKWIVYKIIDTIMQETGIVLKYKLTSIEFSKNMIHFEAKRLIPGYLKNRIVGYTLSKIGMKVHFYFKEKTSQLVT
jgi:hypothetical protein